MLTPAQEHLPYQMVDLPLPPLVSGQYSGLILPLPIPGHPQMLHQPQLGQQTPLAVAIPVAPPQLCPPVASCSELLQEFRFHGTFQKPPDYPHRLLLEISPPVFFPFDFPPQVP